MSYYSTSVMDCESLLKGNALQAGRQSGPKDKTVMLKICMPSALQQLAALGSRAAPALPDLSSGVCCVGCYRETILQLRLCAGLLELPGEAIVNALQVHW